MHDRTHALLEALSRAPRPLTGEELGSLLQVSSRSIRTYVAKLNRDGILVEATHHGYCLTPAGRRSAANAQPSPAVLDTPQLRLQYLCRRLTQTAEALDVHQLAEDLHISDSTLELDLRRVREVMRENDLVLRRHHDFVDATGPERAKRRMLRQLLQQSGRDMVPQWQDLAAAFPQIDMRLLRTRVSEVLAQCEVVLNEYALSDIVLHLAVTIDRMQGGHVLPITDGDTRGQDHQVLAATEELRRVLTRDFGAELPPSEVSSLYTAIAVRAVHADLAGGVVDPEMAQLVHDLMSWVATHYLLGPPSPTTLLKLTAHVQNVVARARTGVALARPLGSAFRNSHPLVHEMALSFAERLEHELKIEVGPPEVDYLALHMGMQYIDFLEQRDLPTMTLVVPDYYDLATNVTRRIRDAVRGRAIVEDTLTSLDADLDRVGSDLVISCVPVGPTMAEVVQVSPLLPSGDLERVLAAVRAEQERNTRRRVKTTIYTLMDPRLFQHVPQMVTKEAALQDMCARLQEQGYVDAGYLEGVLDRERRSPTSFGGAFAIPHSMRMDAHASAISVLVSDHGIPWGTSSVRLVLMFALSEEGRRIFRDGLDEITHLLSDPSTVETLIGSADSAENFLAAMNRLLDS